MLRIREYLKLGRSFNAGLTGISPVMGAIAMGQYNLVHLFWLFLVGFLGHTYGFVLNDILDYDIDKSSSKIGDRPLVRGTISFKKAWIFAGVSLLVALVIAAYIALVNQSFFSVVILVVSAFFITVYNLISKKYPLMDIFVALGVFFLILYGAVASGYGLSQITMLAWIVCGLGSIQVVFMQLIAGGLKDVENDFKRRGKTLAIKMGVRVIDGKLYVPPSFKVLAYSIQLIDLAMVFLPFFIIWNIYSFSVLQYFQGVTLMLIGIGMFILSHGLLSMEHFERFKARKLIGSHYMINFALVPIMLMRVNPWVGLLVLFPVVVFILSNLILHGTILQPKTM